MTKRILSILLALAILAMGVCVSAEEVDKSKTIKVLTGSKSFDMNSDYVSKLLEEKTGYHVEYEYYSDQNQLAMEVASGTEADIIALTTTMYQTLLSQGALKDISGLLEKHPDIKEEIADLGWTYVTHDGGIYGIPQVDDAVYAGGIGYREDIFADHGYTEPNTIDEFYKLLSDIKNDTYSV